jgi:uncharacterized protein (DUF433 family)
MMVERITVDPNVCTGKPCVRGLRFPVSRLLGLLAAGETREAILQAYPYLEPEDIDAALQYAAALADDETIELSKCDSSWTCRCCLASPSGWSSAGTTPFTHQPSDSPAHLTWTSLNGRAMTIES